jgi:hypothetical protein
MNTVKLEHVRRIHDLEAELVRLHLDIIGHAELWGAMSAAGAALKECGRIAHRDIDQDEVAAVRQGQKVLTRPRKGRRR